ncbi:hypothetical protein LCGC14_2730580 [marine sediment metagenome]|uniref:Uncharacterized protein n=1 Tax=marine sediment metagenome TaxID=412755 RepID=A0A0F8Z7H5_9ZZZZ
MRGVKISVIVKPWMKEAFEAMCHECSFTMSEAAGELIKLVVQVKARNPSLTMPEAIKFVEQGLWEAEGNSGREKDSSSGVEGGPK